MQLIRYTNDAFNNKLKYQQLSALRVSLILAVAPNYNALKPVYAYIKSHTISNQKKHAFYYTSSKSTAILCSPIAIRKHSDANTSSSSINKDMAMPVKTELAERKHKRWATQHGFENETEEESFYSQSKTQLHAAMFLRKLSYSLIKPIGKYQDYLSHNSVHQKSDNNFTVPLISPFEERKVISNSIKKSNDTIPFITLIQYEQQTYKRARRMTAIP